VTMCGKHKLKAHENNVRRKMLDIRNVNIIMDYMGETTL
jgi:hypothetical protein